VHYCLFDHFNFIITYKTNYINNCTNKKKNLNSWVLTSIANCGDTVFYSERYSSTDANNSKVYFYNK